MAINIDPATRKFLDTVAAAGGPPIYTLTPNEAQKVLSGAQAGLIKALAADAEKRTLPVGPRGATRVVVVHPMASKAACQW